LYFNIDWKTKR